MDAGHLQVELLNFIVGIRMDCFGLRNGLLKKLVSVRITR